MRVTDAKVEWNEDVANNPRLQVLVDEIPPTESMVFQSAKNKQIWYAEKDGYVRFFAGHPEKDGDGYGGRSYKLNTKEGEVVLNGPYSSRAGVMNKEGFGPCVDVSITTDPSVLDKGYTFSSGSITLEKAKKAIGHVDEAEGLKKTSLSSEPIWVPYK